MRIDLDGNVLSDSVYRINRAGFVIHSAIHAARPDARCVLHTHSRAGVAVSAQKAGLLPLSQQSTLILSSLGYHDYEGIALHAEEQPRLQASLGSANFLVLRNHGLLTVGRTIQDAFIGMYFFENACRIQIDAQGAGAELNLLGPGPIAANANVSKVATAGQGANLAWPALLRKLDREKPGYDS